MTDLLTREWVMIFHPSIKGVGDAQRDAFQRVWSRKGWVVLTEDILDEVPEDRIQAMARSRGINLLGIETKPEMVRTVWEAINDSTRY